MLRHILFNPFVILFTGLCVALIVPLVPFQFGGFCESFHCINGYGSSVSNIVFNRIYNSGMMWLLPFALAFALSMIVKGFMLKPVTCETAVIACCFIMMLVLTVSYTPFANRTTLGANLISWIEYQDRVNYETNFSKRNELKSVVDAELTSIETEPSKDSVSFTLRLSNHSNIAVKKVSGYIFVSMGNQIDSLYVTNVPPINPKQSIDLHLTCTRPSNINSAIYVQRPLPKIAASDTRKLWSLWQPVEMRFATGQSISSNHIF